MISDMISAAILILFVALPVAALERHHRRTWALPHAPLGADATLPFSEVDHDLERVRHDAGVTRF